MLANTKSWLAVRGGGILQKEFNHLYFTIEKYEHIFAFMQSVMTLSNHGP